MWSVFPDVPSEREGEIQTLNTNMFCMSGKIPWTNYISWSFIDTLCSLLIHTLFPSILPTLTAVLKIY